MTRFLLIAITISLKVLICSLSSTAQPGNQKIKYEIVNSRQDNRGLTNSLDVYIVKEADIKALNQKLFNKYKNTGIASFPILYFNNKLIARTYERKVFDKNTSDSEIERMITHLIGKFDYTAINNAQSLHIGKEAQVY